MGRDSIRKEGSGALAAALLLLLMMAAPLSVARPVIVPKETRKYLQVGKPITIAVEKWFAPADIPRVLDQFNNSRRSVVCKKPRIQAAVILLSKGNMKKFAVAMRNARIDWRDVLVWSGLGNANWPEAAAKKGIPGLRK